MDHALHIHTYMDHALLTYLPSNHVNFLYRVMLSQGYKHFFKQNLVQEKRFLMKNIIVILQHLIILYHQYGMRNFILVYIVI